MVNKEKALNFVKSRILDLENQLNIVENEMIEKVLEGLRNIENLLSLYE